MHHLRLINTAQQQVHSSMASSLGPKHLLLNNQLKLFYMLFLSLGYYGKGYTCTVVAFAIYVPLFTLIHSVLGLQLTITFIINESDAHFLSQ